MRNQSVVRLLNSSNFYSRYSVFKCFQFYIKMSEINRSLPEFHVHRVPHTATHFTTVVRFPTSSLLFRASLLILFNRALRIFEISWTWQFVFVSRQSRYTSFHGIRLNQAEVHTFYSVCPMFILPRDFRYIDKHGWKSITDIETGVPDCRTHIFSLLRVFVFFLILLYFISILFLKFLIPIFCGYEWFWTKILWFSWPPCHPYELE